jgi:hypothetical protein
MALRAIWRPFQRLQSGLLAEMKDRAGREVVEDGGFIKNRKALDFSDRDPAEVAEIIQSALRVIPGQGAGSRDHWVKVGMAIHSELPNDLGLTLWAAWSAEDPEYAEEWAGSNPCEEVWKTLSEGAGEPGNAVLDGGPADARAAVAGGGSAEGRDATVRSMPLT